MLRALALTVILVAAGSFALTTLEAQRSVAAQERASVEALRQRSAAVKLELDELGAKIAAQKAQRSNAVLRSGTLDADLRRSQELSGALNGLSLELARAEANAARAEAALLETLNAEIRAAQEAAVRAAPEQRRPLFDRVRSLRAEREALRPRLPAAGAAVGSVTASSEDPEDLLEQADALRDSDDKVRQRLRAVQARLRDAREERALDERMSSFLSDESLFDEQDRRLRVVNDGSGLRAANSGGGGDFGSAEAVRAGDAATGAGNAPAPAPPAEGGTGTGSPPPPPGDVTSPPSAPGGLTAAAPPAVGESGKTIVGGRSVPLSADEELRALEAEQQKLEALSKDLARQAAQLENRARALE